MNKVFLICILQKSINLKRKIMVYAHIYVHVFVTITSRLMYEVNFYNWKAREQ